MHPSRLTTDHVRPRSLADGVRVLCIACNSARRNDHDDEQRTVVGMIDVDGQPIAIVR